MMRLLSQLAAFSLALLIIAAPVALAQDGEIAGRVTNETGEPLPGANVIIEGTTQGSSTDADGNYVISGVAPGTYTVVASIIGFERGVISNVEVSEGETTEVNFELEESTGQMGEVMVIGYGEQARETLTTSVSRMDTTALQSVPHTNLADALQGSIPGLRVQQTSGQPGSTPRIVLRGGTSINNPHGANPLYVVDGVIRPNINDLSSLDIESITVLKDAAATAIYGARASNGVIIIETKEGELGERHLTYTSSFTSSQLRQGYDLGTAREYIEYGRLGVAATGERHPQHLGRLDMPVGFGTGNDLSNRTSFTPQYLNDENRHKLDEGWESMPDPIDPSRTIIFQETDWQDQLFRTALTQDHHLGIRGGGEGTRYNAGIGYMLAQGAAIETDYERFTMNVGGELQIRDNLNLGGRVNFSNSSDNQVFSDNWIFQRALGLAPTAKLRFEDGSLAPGQNISMGNPLYYLDVLERQNTTNRLTLSVDGSWGITPQLVFEPSASLYMISSLSNAFDPAYLAGPGQINNARNASASHGLRWQRQAEGVFNYTPVLGGSHNLEVTTGLSYYDRQQYSLSASGRGAATDLIPTLNAAAEATNVYSFNTTQVILGAFARATYDYQQRYLFSFSSRYDGASNLGSRNQWAFFPGASIGWNAHREAFWSAMPSAISSLKLRGSFGLTGNISGLSDFHAQGLYSVGSEYAGNPVIQNNRMANQDLRWERSTTFDIGLDLGLFDDRVSVIADAYRRVTDDLLTNFVLPTSTGFTSLLTNLGSLENRGVEMEMAADVIQGQEFNWRLSFNTAYNQNTILRLPENQNENNRIGGVRVYDTDSGEYVWVGGLQEGRPMGDMYAFHHLGVYSTDEEAANGPIDTYMPGSDQTPKAGDAILADLDGSGRIESTDQVYVGNEFPDWTGGFSSTLNYNDFSLYLRTDFALGHTIYNQTLMTFNAQSQGDINISRQVLDSWQEQGDQTNIPRYYWADQLSQNNMFRDGSGTSYYYEPGDYLSLREVTLSYNIRGALLSELGLQRVRAYVTGNNLGYLSPYRGLLPEAGGWDTGRYPNPISLTVGMNVTL